MSLFLADTPFSAVVWLAVKATAILAAAAVLHALWYGRTSAAPNGPATRARLSGPASLGRTLQGMGP